jgi:cytoplasmic iron level regulating protein YaaA (DUF328/UPF0246 family)
MKIIFSPAKSFKETKEVEKTPLLFENETKLLIDKIKSINSASHLKFYKVKSDQKLNEILEFYELFNQKTYSAINLYNGISYKELEIGQYDSKSLEYMNNTLCILDALYGVLRPNDSISKYRFDFTMKIPEFNTVKLWKEKLNPLFEDTLIINLASKEFSSLLKSDKMITIDFRQQYPDKLKNVSVFTKRARGSYLNWMIKNKVSDITMLKKYNLDGYQIDESQSDDNYLLFVKQIEE